MTNITLIMTRTPVEEVNFGKKNGRWGRMIAVAGAKVLSARFTDFMNVSELSGMEQLAGTVLGGAPIGAIAAIANTTSAILHNASGRTSVRIGQRNLSLETMGGEIKVVGEFDTLERYRTDSDRSKFYVQLRPRPERPYEIRMDISKRVKGNEEKKGVNETGFCFRVHGHDTKHSGGGIAGILIHEAPHPGWLIGCIGPREINQRTVSHNKGPSRMAMETIFRLMGGFSRGKKADLLVMDW